MDKTTQDLAWRVLPKEFKEEVKEIYLNAVEHHPCGYNHKTDLLKYLFSHYNLTSNAEGEETLICEKSKVQRAYNTSREIVKAENPDSLMYSIHTQIMCVLESIFGSECLPDEEPKPAEPKEEAAEHFNTILKDSFQNERRLNIAAQILSGIVASGKPCRQPVKRVLELTDALIAECEKGGDNAAE